MNEEQKQAVLIAKLGKNIFITGPAGTGKTYVLRTIIENAENSNKNVQVTASTGMAASLLMDLSVNGSRTLHSFIGFKMIDQQKTAEQVAERIRMSKIHRKRLNDVDVLVIDEFSMISLDCFKKVDAVLRRVRSRPNQPFGGVQMILSGDFFQLGPVQSRLEKNVFEDPIWEQSNLHTVQLIKVYRQSNEDFLNMLAKIRVGNVDASVCKLIDQTSKNKLENDMGIKPTVLYACNEDVDRMNREELDRLPGKLVTHRAIDVNITEQTTAMINLPEILNLKVDAQVMVTMNIPFLEVVNGSRGVVTSISDTRVQLRLLSGRTVNITRCVQEFDDDVSGKECSRAQFPLKLAWTMTIHKCQGQSIDYLVIDMSRIFADGQAYTAISRGTNLSNMSICNFNPRCVRVNRAVLEYFTKDHQEQPTKKICYRLGTM